MQLVFWNHLLIVVVFFANLVFFDYCTVKFFTRIIYHLGERSEPSHIPINWLMS
jgi:hypothetical protein